MKKITIILTVLIAITMRTNAQWISQSSGVSVNIQSVVFTDANTGIAVGNGGIILRTINGGSNWIAQTSGTINDLFEVLQLSETDFTIFFRNLATIKKADSAKIALSKITMPPLLIFFMLGRRKGQILANVPPV